MLDMKEFPGFKELVRNTFHAYTRTKETFLKLIALSFVGPALIVAMGGLSALLLSVNTLLLIPLVIVGFILVVYVQMWLAISVMLASSAALRGKDIDVKQILAKARTKVISLWWVGLLEGAIVLGGLLLFIVPGIIFGFWFMLASYILVFEGVKGMNALLKSREYIRGYATHLFVSLLFFQLILAAIQYIPVEILKSADLATIASAYSMISQAVLAPLSVIFMYQLYREVKRQKPDVASEYPRARKNKYYLVAFLAPIVLLILIGASAWVFGNVMQ
jgi:hypothetical protein